MDSQDGLVGILTREVRQAEIHSFEFAAMADTASFAGSFHQDAPHGFGSRREKVPAAPALIGRESSAVSNMPDTIITHSGTIGAIRVSTTSSMKALTSLPVPAPWLQARRK